MGSHEPASDIDLAVEGLSGGLEAEALRSELEELPLAQRFDVKDLDRIRHQPLREHIARVGVVIYER